MILEMRCEPPPSPHPPPLPNIWRRAFFTLYLSRIDNPFDTRSNAHESIALWMVPHSCTGDTFYFVSDRLIMYVAVIPCHLFTLILLSQCPVLVHATAYVPTGTTRLSMLTREARDTLMLSCKDSAQISRNCVVFSLVVVRESGCIGYFQFTIA